MTVRLRPHHLLCILTYVGKGYSPAFVENYDRIAERLSAGEPVAIVEGPDAICAAIDGTPGAHCRNASVTERDKRAADDVGKALGRVIEVGTMLSYEADRLDTLRQAFAAGRIRSACAGCEWDGLCTGIAAGGFEGVKITGP